MVKILSREAKLKVAGMIKAGMTQAQVARQMNVSADTIRRVLAEVKAGKVAPVMVFGQDHTINGELFVKRGQLIIEPDNLDLGYVFARDMIAYDDNVEECYVDYADGDVVYEGIKCRGIVLSREYYADDFSAADYMLRDAFDHMISVIEPDEEEDEEIEAIWNASSKFISITVGRKTYNADSSHPNFKAALAALVADEVAKALDLINIERGISKFIKGDIRIEDGTLFYQDIELRTGLTQRIVDMAAAGEDFEFLIPFLENLMLNPSRSAVYRLFDFLEANDIEITDDGYFLAWKRVRDDYTDCHSGQFDNSVGKVVTMPRNMVDEDDETTCSAGLHVCSKSYLNHFGGARIVQVKVHPRDVVSIPVDYGNAKMRTCQYEVIADVTDTLEY